MPSTCRSCGASVKWIKMKSGKWMPCDFEFVSANDCEPGMVLVTEDGEVHKITNKPVVSGEGCMPVEGYVSHFSSCPDADKWRTGS